MMSEQDNSGMAKVKTIVTNAIDLAFLLSKPLEIKIDKIETGILNIRLNIGDGVIVEQVDIHNSTAKERLLRKEQ